VSARDERDREEPRAGFLERLSYLTTNGPCHPEPEEQPAEYQPPPGHRSVDEMDWHDPGNDSR
jgi:hypothetical protein